ncbi:MAG: NAD(P)/FAD-dependent oxidoreductase [Myxococcota bacterium]
MERTVHDVLIVGGGPAGMAAALVAGRARLSTVLFDAGEPRNAVTKASHGFLSRDGVAPVELRRIGREQLGRYGTVRLHDGRVAGVSQLTDGFEVTHEDGTRWRGRRILLATGHRAELAMPGIPDLEAVYGTSVFPCPFCDGFEHAGERIAVFASEMAGHMGPMLRVWTDDVVVFTNGRPLADGLRQAFASRGVGVEERPIVALDHDDGVLRAVRVDGASIPRDSGFVAEMHSAPATPFAEQLGVGAKLNDWGLEVPDVTEDGSSSVKGVYVLGDARTGFSGVTGAANEGYACMVGIVHAIARERWEAA